MTNFLQLTLEKEDVRVVQFGDQFLSDVWATSEFNQKLKSDKSQASWDSIAVIQELS